MARNIIVNFLILVSYFYLQAFSSLAKNNLNTWCSQTPYREPCKHFMSHLKPKHKTEFQKWVIQIALNHTIMTHGHIKELGTKCRNDRKKGAWADCVTLYDSTISILNKTLDYSMRNHCTNFDKQIWLSTALTNLEVCQTGLTELGLDHDIDFMPYHMSNNVSMLISNSLAMHINKGTIETQSNKQVGFPTWVNRRDRKLLQNSSVVANLVVAQDGSGNYKTIGEALDVASKRARNGRFVIRIKKGLYKEYLEIGTNLKNIMLVGDGMQSTTITGSRSNGGGFTTFNSATVAVTGDGFIARGITFRNTAGPENHQAVALRVASDHSVFYQCSFEGYQDTLYTFSQRQFYKDSNIYGTIDFIFGNSASVFQNCNIILRKPLPSQKNTVTAQGRSDPNQNTGIIIQNCRIIPSSELKTVGSSFRSYLGRPWKKYSRTIVMQSFVDKVIDSAGWLKWDGDFGIDTLFYGEYKNYGPGSSVNGRVKWRGFKIITSKNEASLFSVRNFIGGQSWLPSTGVPFTSDI